MLGTRRTIGIVSGLVLAAGLYLTATPTQSVPSIMQAQQLEVVTQTGRSFSASVRPKPVGALRFGMARERRSSLPVWTPMTQSDSGYGNKASERSRASAAISSANAGT